MQNLTIGVHIVARDTQGLLDGIEAADHAGIDVAWLTSGGVAPDPLAVFAAAAGRVQRIQFGTSIVPTFPRHPLAMAQGALVVDSLAPGRLRLGVGPSHKPTMEGTFGIPFQRPQEHLREYLTVLNALLKDGKVSHHGARLHADAGLAGPTGVRVMASALRGKAFRLCGELTDGAISWVCPPAYLREVALPALEEGAAAAGRPTPALVAHVPVVVSDDPTLVRDAARQQLSRYPTIPYYRRMFQDAGFPPPGDGAPSERFLDALLDTLVVHGDAEAVATQIRALPETAGATEIIATLLPAGAAALDRTLTLLGELARGD